MTVFSKQSPWSLYKACARIKHTASSCAAFKCSSPMASRNCVLQRSWIEHMAEEIKPLQWMAMLLRSGHHAFILWDYLAVVCLSHGPLPAELWEIGANLLREQDKFVVWARTHHSLYILSLHIRVTCDLLNPSECAATLESFLSKAKQNQRNKNPVIPNPVPNWKHGSQFRREFQDKTSHLRCDETTCRRQWGPAEKILCHSWSIQHVKQVSSSFQQDSVLHCGAISFKNWSTSCRSKATPTTVFQGL